VADRFAKRVLLLGWDAADWKVIQPLLDAGQMPFLEQLINNGVMGDLATLRPILSPLLWTSIATGKRADQHGIHGFIEPRPDGQGVRPVTSTSLTAQPLWNIVEKHGLRSSVVGWFATQPATALRGTVVSNLFAQASGESFVDWPVLGASFSPPELAEVLQDLRVHPSEIGAAELEAFVPNASGLLQRGDMRIQELRRLLAKASTVHAVGTYLAERDDWDLLAVYYDAIDLTCHEFMEFHPPRMDHVDAADFELYQHVISGMYRFHDMMLGRYMNLVGPDTTIIIVSDHGFHSDHLRPDVSANIDTGKPVDWHREHGVFLACGPGIRKDQLVFGATLLDIAPTVLTLLGIPVGRDMPGRVLRQCFDNRVDVEMVDTHELPPGPASAEVAAEDPWEAQGALRQLIALGYIEPIAEDAAKAIEQATLSRHLNLAEAHYSAGHYAESHAHVQAALAIEPDNDAARLRLAHCELNLGELDAARRLATELEARQPESPLIDLLWAQIHLVENQDDVALERLQQAQARGGGIADIDQRIGLIYMRRKHWTEAREHFERSLDVDPHNAAAYHGLGIAAYQLADRQAAIEHLMRAVALRFDRPLAHYQLGVVLAETGNPDAAIASLHNALKVAPQLRDAHDALGKLYAAQGDAHNAHFHKAKAASMSGGTSRSAAAATTS